MKFDDTKELVKNNFVGFISICELQRTNCIDVPDKKGNYLIIRPVITAPKFLLQNIGGHYNGDPTVEIEEIQMKWVDSVIVLYIGRAGKVNNNRTIRQRLREYMRFGQGNNVAPHWGGRYIWQLANSGSLLVCWKPTQDPELYETQLLEDFSQQYECLPFANLQNR